MYVVIPVHDGHKTGRQKYDAVAMYSQKEYTSLYFYCRFCEWDNRCLWT